MDSDPGFAALWREANRQRVADLRSRWLTLVLALMLIGVGLGFGLAIAVAPVIELAGQYP